MCGQIPTSEHEPAQSTQPTRVQHTCVCVCMDGWNECKSMCNKQCLAATGALESLILSNQIRESGLLLDFPGKPPTVQVNTRAKAGN